MKSLGLFIIMIISLSLQGQSVKKIYDPEAKGEEQIEDAILKASDENKNIFIMIGGNWCPWCLRFHRFVHEDQKIDSLLKHDYVLVMMNYSKENKNLGVLKKLDFPQRFGFPVFVILNKEGERIHTQNSALLESGKGYDRKKVIEFLLHWRPAALDIKNYEDYK